MLNVDTLESIDGNSISALKSVTGTSTTITDQPLEIEYINIVATDEDGNEATYSMATVDNRNSVSGSVVDGYIRNALVCVDFNLNDECDDGEPYQKTDASGDYAELMVSESELGAVEVPIIVIQGGVDIATGERFTSLLKAPVLNGTAQVNLSPITGILAQKLITSAAEDSSFVLDQTELETAKTAVADTLGLPSTVDVMDDPIAAAQTLGSDGKTLLQKAIQIQKIVEIVAAAEKDATGDTDTENGYKRAKTSNVLRALAAQMDSTGKSMTDIIGGMADASADIPKASAIKTTLQAVADKVAQAFDAKGTDLTAAEINQINSVAETVSEAIEAQVDSQWDASVDSFSFDAGAATAELSNYDITGDANLWDKMEVDRLLRMAGVDQTTDVSEAEYDYLLELFYSNINIDGTTTIEEFLPIVLAETNDATFDAALVSTIQTLINSYLIQYANLLRLNNSESVTIAASETAYFSFFSSAEAKYYFELSSGGADLSTDVSVSLYSDSSLSTESALTPTDSSASSLLKLESDDFLEGEYWLKITNTSASSVTFDLEVTLKQALVSQIFQKLLTDDFSNGEQDQQIPISGTQLIQKIDSGRLIMGTKYYPFIRTTRGPSIATFNAPGRKGVKMDVELVQIDDTQNGMTFQIEPIWLYTGTDGLPVAATFNMSIGADGTKSVNYGVIRCNDLSSDCDTDISYLSNESFANATFDTGEEHTISILWDGANGIAFGYDSFLETVDMTTVSGGNSAFGSLTIAGEGQRGVLSDRSGEVSTQAVISVPAYTESCTGLFAIDDIQVNDGSGWTSFETFDSGSFDATKWTRIFAYYVGDEAYRITSVDDMPGFITSPYMRAESFQADITLLDQEGGGSFIILRPVYLNGDNVVFSMVQRAASSWVGYVFQCPKSEAELAGYLETTYNHPIFSIRNADVLFKQELGTVTSNETNTIYSAFRNNVIQFRLDDGTLYSITPLDIGVTTTALPIGYGDSNEFQNHNFIAAAFPLPSIPDSGVFDLAGGPSGSLTDVMMDNLEVKTGKMTVHTGIDWEFASESLYDDFSGGSMDDAKWDAVVNADCPNCSVEFSDGKMVATSTFTSGDSLIQFDGLNFDSANTQPDPSFQGFSVDVKVRSYEGAMDTVSIYMYPYSFSTYPQIQVIYLPETGQVEYTVFIGFSFVPVAEGTLLTVTDPSATINMALGFDGTYAYFKADEQTAAVKMTELFPLNSASKLNSGLRTLSGADNVVGNITAEYDNVIIGEF